MSSIIVNPRKHDGKPHFAGTDILAKDVYDLISDDVEESKILKQFAPHLKSGDIETLKKFAESRDVETGEQIFRNPFKEE